MNSQSYICRMEECPGQILTPMSGGKACHPYKIATLLKHMGIWNMEDRSLAPMSVQMVSRTSMQHFSF